MEKKPVVLIVATMDTKAQEALYAKECFEEAGTEPLIIDVGILGESPVPVTVTREEVASVTEHSLKEIQEVGHEGKALSIMTKGAVYWVGKMYRDGSVNGVFGLGGSMGTTIGTAVMRSLPVGFPKVMVTTMASRNTRAFVGTKDIAMLHSVCDLSGLNRITARIIRNGAMALAGMVAKPPLQRFSDKPFVIISTLGTTETCAQALRKQFGTKGMEVVVFHTNGSGGEAMEEMMVGERPFTVIDLSLHELMDHRFGGDYDAGPERGSVALKLGIPTILVPGNTDFLVSGPLAIAKRHFPGRTYHAHNDAITCIQTTSEEIGLLGEAIARFCNEAESPFSVVVPMKGFSVFDRPGGPFFDPARAAVFLEAMQTAIVNRASLISLPYHVNDPEFASELIKISEKLAG